MQQAFDQAGHIKDVQAAALLNNAEARGLAGLCEGNESVVQQALALDRSKQNQELAALQNCKPTDDAAVLSLPRLQPSLSVALLLTVSATVILGNFPGTVLAVAHAGAATFSAGRAIPRAGRSVQSAI